MRFRRMMVSVLAFWVVAMLLPTSASAQFRLRIEDLVSGQGVVVTDLVGGLVFLASSASDFVNGQVLYVDGGMTAAMS